MERPRVETRPAADLTSAELADVMNRAFAGYLVPVSVTRAAFEARFRSEHVDPEASRVLIAGGDAVGLILVARRGWTSRIAAMGVAPAARGTGAGRRALEDVIADARARGERRLILEVFERNERALSLYRGLGFREARRLVGHRLERASGRAEPGLQEVDPSDVARLAAHDGEPDLPWMLAPETLAAAAPPARALALEGALTLISDPGRDTVALHALVVPRDQRRQGLGSRTLRALFETFPGKAWVVPAIVPEDLAPGFLEGVGFAREELSQLEMALDLA